MRPLSKIVSVSVILAAVLVIGLGALLGGSVVAATITAPDTPQAFANQLVALYSQNPHTTEEGRTWDQLHDSLFDPEFSKLMTDNRTLSNKVFQSPPSIYGDAMCGCEGFVSVQICSVGLRSNGLADIKAAYHQRLDNQPPDDCTNMDNVDLVIKRINGAWKLFDVMHLAGRSGGVRDELIRDNACMRLVENETVSDRVSSTYQRCVR